MYLWVPCLFVPLLGSPGRQIHMLCIHNLNSHQYYIVTIIFMIMNMNICNKATSTCKANIMTSCFFINCLYIQSSAWHPVTLLPTWIRLWNQTVETTGVVLRDAVQENVHLEVWSREKMRNKEEYFSFYLYSFSFLFMYWRIFLYFFSFFLLIFFSLFYVLWAHLFQWFCPWLKFEP